MMKVITILGTRPEIIRLSQVIRLLDRHVQHVLVHTGQNSDFELNDVFFRDLAVRPPDHYLGINRQSVGRILGEVLIKTEEILLQERPDAVLILGDTNSAFGAVIAKRLKIPVYHMEAGNRCFDMNVPEEINRRIIDHISDFNLVYTEHARRNLIAEGIHPRKVYLTGSPMREVLEANRSHFQNSTILEQLKISRDQYLLVSMHRADNVDVPERLDALLELLDKLAERYGLPVIVSTHPRTRQRLDTTQRSSHPLVRFLKPFGFHDYIRLQQDAFCTLSDSGTISEEASILGFPAVTMRMAIERPEAMDSGHIVLTGLNVETILNAVEFVTSHREYDREHRIPEEYEVRNTSHRVVKLILGTCKLGHIWDGVIAA